MADGGTSQARRAALDALDADSWAVALGHARAALDSLPSSPGDGERDLLRAASTGRLAGGKGRNRLTALLATDEPLWAAFLLRLQGADDLIEPLAQLLGSGQLEGDTAGEAGPAVSGTGDVSASALAEAKRRAKRDRDKLRDAREALASVTRRAAGAEGRATAVSTELAEVTAERDRLAQRVDELEAALATAAAEQVRAVERERRRRDTEVEALKSQLAAQRRAEEERLTEARRQEAARDMAQRDAAARAEAERRKHQPPRLVPGRPSELPEGVVPGTREAVEHYLHRGRRVLVDGYNVTLKHQPSLDLERQRSWLVQGLANLARQRGVTPTVIFDGERAGGGRSVAGAREVLVRFTSAGITADDEIVLELESTDEPVLVVTDDRGLVERVRRSGADVITTGELVRMW